MDPIDCKDWGRTKSTSSCWRARVSFTSASEGFPDTAFADDGKEPRVCGRDFAFQDERGFHLCASRCRKAKGLTA